MRRLSLTVAAALLFAGPAAAQMELKIMVPAGPGGGWDQTARSMQTALVASGAAKSVQVMNVPAPRHRRNPRSTPPVTAPDQGLRFRLVVAVDEQSRSRSSM